MSFIKNIRLCNIVLSGSASFRYSAIYILYLIVSSSIMLDALPFNYFSFIHTKKRVYKS